MNVEIPFAPRRASGRSVRSITIITSAVPPFVAHALVPESTHSSPSCTARAESDAASEPDSGSESAKPARDRKSTRLNSSHGYISYAVFCLKKKKKHH